jgi:hypothetical protein
MTTMIFAVAAAFSFVAAALSLSQPAYAFQNGEFVGKSKAFLLSCAGVPQSAMNSEGVEYFTYTNSRSRGGTVTTQQFGNIVTGQVGMATDSCQINFAIKSGRIISSNARSSGGIFTGPMACERIVGSCRQ